jgi:hypothetical protein
MNDHVIDDEPNKDNAVDYERYIVQVDGLVQPVKPYLLDLLHTGWDELAKLNVKEVRKHAIQ